MSVNIDMGMEEEWNSTKRGNQNQAIDLAKQWSNWDECGRTKHLKRDEEEWSNTQRGDSPIARNVKIDMHHDMHHEYAPWLCNMNMCRSAKRDCSCDNGGKRFRRPSNLNMHRGIHSGVGSYHCRVCKTGFKMSSALHKHNWNHAQFHHPPAAAECTWRITSKTPHHFSTAAKCTQ